MWCHCYMHCCKKKKGQLLQQAAESALLHDISGVLLGDFSARVGSRSESDDKL